MPTNYALVDFEEHARFAAELQREVTKALEETAEKEIKRYEKKYRVVVHQPGDRVLVDKGVKNRNRQEVKLVPAVIVEGLEYGAYTVEWLSGINKGKMSDEDCHLIRPDPKANASNAEELEQLNVVQISEKDSTTASKHSPNKKKRKFSNVYEDLELSPRSVPLEDIVARGVAITEQFAAADVSECLEVDDEKNVTRSDTHQWKLICDGVLPLPKRRRL